MISVTFTTGCRLLDLNGSVVDDVTYDRLDCDYFSASNTWQFTTFKVKFLESISPDTYLELETTRKKGTAVYRTPNNFTIAIAVIL